MRVQARILVMGADARGRAKLSRLLTMSGYETFGIGTSRELAEVLTSFETQRVDLIVLSDPPTPKCGLAWCNSIRTRTDVPIILLSAQGREADLVAGLDAGADDFIAMPFTRSELLARTRALLRRARKAGVASRQNAPAEFYSFDGWHLYCQQQLLRDPSGEDVPLTAAEYKLLLELLRHAPSAVGRERLMELVYSRLPHSSDRSIDILVSRLRRKLGEVALIRTARGVGYIFVAKVQSIAQE